MKAIRIVVSGEILGSVVPSGVISYNIFRTLVGESWTRYCMYNKDLDLIRFIEFHNSKCYLQIEQLESEVVTLDG